MLYNIHGKKKGEKMDFKFIISIFILIGGILFAINKAKKGKSFMLTILVAISISVAIFIYPGFNGDSNIIVNLINTVYYIIQAWLLNADISLVQNENIGNELMQIWVCAELLSLPILTAGTVLETLQKYFGKMKMAFIGKNDLHIFSDVNDKTVKIAELIKKDFTKDKIIFCKYNSSNDQIFTVRRKGIYTKDDITTLNIKLSDRNTKFYMISQNEDEVLDQTITLIEKYRKQKCEILCFTSNEENKMILDELDKGNVVVNIIDEIQGSIYHLLIKHPLYQNTQNNRIKALIVGLGHVGKEAFKSIMWCGQMPKYSLEMNVIEKDEEKVKELSFECPEIFEHAEQYHLNCYLNDIRELEMNKELQEQLKDTNYVIVATGDEENNIKIAKNLRRIFLENSSVEPEIFIWMEESIKKEKVKNIKNYFIFKTFGDYNETYGSIRKNSELEKLAIKLHLTYNDKDINLKEYNKIEYNKKSSRAMALHLKYKLYPYIKRDEKGKMINGEIDRILQDENILAEITESEHNRWLTYLRTEGYKYEPEQIAEKYFAKVGKLREYFLKMHPALVEWNQLDEVKKSISEIENEPEKDMKENTKESIIKMLQSIGKEIKDV